MRKNVFGIFVFLLVLVLLASAAPTMIYAAPKAAIVSETFTNSTASGWVLSDSACLTAGSNTLACAATPNNEGNGNGWLRLTSATNNQKASAIYNTAFASTNGIQVQFLYASYGGSGADGISFYLIDGATGSPTTGAAGGGLGYSFNTVSPVGPGVTNGYTGIGLDEYGNFGNTGYSSSPCFTSLNPGITIIGSGNLNTGFNCLQHSTTVLTGARTAAKWARITIAPSATSMTVQTSSDGVTWTTRISSFNLATSTGQAALPATFKMGFSGSTGGSTNFHEVRNLTVTGANPSTTTPVCVPNPSNLSQSVTCTATVAGNPQVGSNIPSGTIDFYDGATLLQAGVVLNGSAQATYTTSAFTVGTHPINANYGGDSVYGASSGSTNQVVNNKLTPTNVLVSSLNPSFVGDLVTFTATLSGSGGTPTGTVTFQDAGVNVAGCINVALVSGVATCPTAALAAGTHPMTAVYGGDATYFGNTSNTVNQVVNKRPTTTTVTSSSNPCVKGQSVTFTAAVIGTPGTPTGTVMFYYDGVAINPPGAIALVTGHARYTMTCPGASTHRITAVYGGDATFLGSDNITAPLQQVFVDPPADVPEGDTLLLMGGGLGGVITWLGWQRRKLTRKNK